MTELEKIERAKMYMDKLANGINPIDGTMAPDDDLINNVRLSRCFFFISDVLRQVIENGGTKTAVNKKPKKLPLEIPMEKRSQFVYSEVPIPAGEIAKRINALADNDTMQKLTYSGILTWLTEIGMMEWALAPDGKHTENWRRKRHFRGRTNEQQRTLSGCRLQQCRAAFYHRQSGCNSHSREYADRDARRSMDERSR